MFDKRRRIYQDFGTFVRDLARDLNHLSESGWAVLIEGPRDARAMRKLGYTGRLTTIGEIGRRSSDALAGVTSVVILTDLDREGALLASRYVRQLRNQGVRTSLNERRRLKAASRGVFLHIENLGRFEEY